MPSTDPALFHNHICDALQQNGEQITQAYFKIWTIEVGGMKIKSSVNFQTFVRLFVFTYLNPNLPDPVNFVPFGTMRYSPFDINLISITCILFVYLYFCLFLIKKA